MLKRVLSFSLCHFLLTQAVAAQLYQVQKGDTLSELALRFYPQEPLYTYNGSLSKLMALNPEITNPHLIAIGQSIRIRKPQKNQLQTKRPLRPKVLLPQEPEPLPVSMITTVSFGLGGAYYNLNQSGASGLVDLSVLLFNSFEIRQKTSFKEMSFQAKIRSSELEIVSNGTSKLQQRQSSLDLELFYHSFSIGFMAHQQPLILRLSETIELERQSSLFLKLGHRFNMMQSQQSSLLFESSVQYQLKNSLGSSVTRLTETSGYGLSAELVFERRFNNSNFGFTLPILMQYFSSQGSLSSNRLSGPSKTQELILRTFVELSYSF